MRQFRGVRFFALLLISVMCMGLLVGCAGGKDDATTTDSTENVITMTITVMGSFPSLSSIDETGFYCMDEEMQLWRIEWSDTGAIEAGAKYTVRIKDSEPQEPAASGWSPKFKGTAVSVTPLA